MLAWLEELSLWVYVVLVGGWLLQRWARKMAHPQSKLDRVHARWPSFRCDELEELIAAHGGDAEAAGATIQQHILPGKYPLVELEMTKEDVSTRLGCLLSGQPSHLPSDHARQLGGGLAQNRRLNLPHQRRDSAAAAHALLHLSIT